MVVTSIVEEPMTLMTNKTKQLHGVEREGIVATGKCYPPGRSVIRVASVIDRARSPLELVLLSWACDHWPEPVDAILAKWGDWEFERKCLGAIFRRAAAVDPVWFYATCEERPREVLALAPSIREIPWVDLGGLAEWGSIPGRMGWGEYVRAVGTAGGLQ